MRRAAIVKRKSGEGRPASPQRLDPIARCWVGSEEASSAGALGLFETRELSIMTTSSENSWRKRAVAGCRSRSHEIAMNDLHGKNARR